MTNPESVDITRQCAFSFVTLEFFPTFAFFPTGASTSLGKSSQSLILEIFVELSLVLIEFGHGSLMDFVLSGSTCLVAKNLASDGLLFNGRPILQRNRRGFFA